MSEQIAGFPDFLHCNMTGQHCLSRYWDGYKTIMFRKFFLLALLLILSACNRTEGEHPVMVGNIARQRVELVAESNDRLISIAVQEGDKVKAGTLIFEQDPALYQARLAQLQAARDRAAANLAELERGPREESIRAARARVQGARETLKIQQREYDRIARLVNDKLASPSLLDQAEQQRSSASALVDQLTAELAALETGATTEQHEQFIAALAEADAAIHTQQTLIERLAVRAPADSLVDSLPFEVGERPLPGATVAVLLTGDLPYARVYVPEPLRSSMTAGTMLTIRVDGISTPFQGKVRYVSTDAAFTPYYSLTQHDRSRLSYLAEIDFVDANAASLPSGVPVEVTLPGPAGGP